MRETKLVRVPHFEICRNRDEGKQYLITEWAAARADNWIQRLTHALLKNGDPIPLDLAGRGWEVIGIVGLNTFLRGRGDSSEVIRLTDELLECVQIVRDPKHPETASSILHDTDDIEEIATRYWLRDQVVSVHANFSVLDNLWRLLSSITTKSPDSKNTSTSPPGSDS